MDSQNVCEHIYSVKVCDIHYSGMSAKMLTLNKQDRKSYSSSSNLIKKMLSEKNLDLTVIN